MAARVPTISGEELAAMPQTSIGTQVAAAVLGCDRYSLNVAAKKGMLHIQHYFSGNRLYISKAALLDYIGYKAG